MMFFFANESLDSRDSRLVSVVRLVKLKTVNFCFFLGTLTLDSLPLFASDHHRLHPSVPL
jgi:hypothetical protein